MVGDDQVDIPVEISVEEISQEHLADFHVDTDDGPSNLEVRIAIENPGVRERVEQPVPVKVDSVCFVQLIELDLFFGQLLLDLFFAPEVVLDPGFYDRVI